MSFFAYLEVDNGDQLSIRGNGINRGKALLAFLAIYQYTITKNEESSELRWFTQFEEQANMNFRKLTQIYYSEDSLYSKNEYNKFIADWGHISGYISESDFRKRIEGVEKMWSPIDEIILIVEQTIRILSHMGEDVYWYVAQDTQPAFQALLDTLRQAQEIGGQKVKILFR